jgi:transcriptional regulator with XRE-family HTH domain
MEHCSFKKALGSVICELRRERKLSQEQLAYEADVDRTRTGQIERGEANPTVDTLARIADVLGYTLGTLIVRAELIAYDEVPCSDELVSSWVITSFRDRQ